MNKAASKLLVHLLFMSGISSAFGKHGRASVLSLSLLATAKWEECSIIPFHEKGNWGCI